MSSPVQLSATDSLFLATETENNYNHTAGLMVLKPRRRGGL